MQEMLDNYLKLAKDFNEATIKLGEAIINSGILDNKLFVNNEQIYLNNTWCEATEENYKALVGLGKEFVGNYDKLDKYFVVQDCFSSYYEIKDKTWFDKINKQIHLVDGKFEFVEEKPKQWYEDKNNIGKLITDNKGNFTFLRKNDFNNGYAFFDTHSNPLAFCRLATKEEALSLLGQGVENDKK